MNHKTDQLAKQYLGYCAGNIDETHIEAINYHHWAVQMEDRYICRNFSTEIEDIINTHALKTYIGHEKGMPEVTFNTIDWEGIKQVSTKLTISEGIWRTKLACNIHATNKNLKQTSYSYSFLCS